MKTLDKYLTEGAAGISQRLEKIGLVMGTIESIVKRGFLVHDICTDQCKGAPSDIGKVLERQDVRKMLVHGQEKLRAWRAELLGAGGVERSEIRPSWASRVEELHASFEEMAEVVDGIAKIVHHFDVFHVEVKVVESLTAFINDSTKQVRPSKTARKAKASWELRGEPLNEALRRVADKLQPAELKVLGVKTAPELKEKEMLKGKLDEKQCMLKRALGGGEGEGEAEGEHDSGGDFMPDQMETEVEAPLPEAGGGSSTLSAEEKEQDEERKADNRDRLAGRKELLDAKAGLLDTVRHHFYRVAQFAAMLIMAGKPVAEIQGAAWELWTKGLLGHVYHQTHEFCGPSAACKQEGYVNPAKLGRLARALFMQFVLEPKLKELINKCIYNGHTWHCESLSNLAHTYQPKRIVYRAGQANLMTLAKLDMNENRWTRFVQKYKERKRRTGMRRLAQKDTTFLEPVLSKKTYYFRQEAWRRLYLNLVDRNASLPSIPWPPNFAPVAVVPPQPRPVAGQLPPALEALGAKPTQSASIIGPLVGADGSLHELVQQKQPQGWRKVGAKQPPLPQALSRAGVLEKIGQKKLYDVTLLCPGCQVLLSAKLPSGLSQLRCNACSAAPLHTPVAPPKEKQKPGRSSTSHHAPPLNQKMTGRPPTAFNQYIQKAVPERQAQAKAAGTPETSMQSFSLAAQEWPSVRDAAATLSGGQPRTASTAHPRRASRTASTTRPPPPPPPQQSGAGMGAGPSSFYREQPSSDDDEEQERQAAASLRRARSSAARGARTAAPSMPPPRAAPHQPDTDLSDVELEREGPPSPHAGATRRDYGGKADSASRPSKARTQPEEGAPLCNVGHVMQYTEVDDPHLSCDKCEAALPMGQMAYSCAPCNFDMCLACLPLAGRRRRPRSLPDL